VVDDDVCVRAQGGQLWLSRVSPRRVNPLGATHCPIRGDVVLMSSSLGYSVICAVVLCCGLVYLYKY